VLKGSVLGPMVLCGICFSNSKLDFLTEIGVKDSKKLSPKKRSELAKILKINCHCHKTIVVSPREIDDRQIKKLSLNRLEELKMAEILNELKPDIVILDAVDVNEVRFGKSIGDLLDYYPQKIISKHKADDIYPIVSAASIVAKYKRDFLIEELYSEYGNFGSGYPSDGKTIKFIRNFVRENKNVPRIARKSWDTINKIVNEELLNKKMTEFFK
jgi:ribonuclease HII